VRTSRKKGKRLALSCIVERRKEKYVCMAEAAEKKKTFLCEIRKKKGRFRSGCQRVGKEKKKEGGRAGHLDTGKRRKERLTPTT